MSAQLALPLARPLASVFLLAGLFACGGGGSSKADFTLSFTPERLTARYFHNQHHGVNTFTPPVTATVNGTIDPVPTSNLYVLVMEDSPVFQGNPSLVSLGGTRSRSL